MAEYGEGAQRRCGGDCRRGWQPWKQLPQKRASSWPAEYWNQPWLCCPRKYKAPPPPIGRLRKGFLFQSGWRKKGRCTVLQLTLVAFLPMTQGLLSAEEVAVGRVERNTEVLCSLCWAFPFASSESRKQALGRQQGPHRMEQAPPPPPFRGATCAPAVEAPVQAPCGVHRVPQGFARPPAKVPSLLWKSQSMPVSADL